VSSQFLNLKITILFFFWCNVARKYNVELLVSAGPDCISASKYNVELAVSAGPANCISASKYNVELAVSAGLANCTSASKSLDRL
jgi:hypothetical protein